MKCSSMFHECLSNLNNSSITLTTLITFILLKNVGSRSLHAVAAKRLNHQRANLFQKA